MFCIKCGKEAFRENLCEKCYIENKSLFSIKEMRLNYCNNCNRFYTKTNKFTGKADLEGFILKNTETMGKIVSMHLDFSSAPENIRGTLTAKGCIRPSKILVNDRKKFIIRPRKMKCENCVKSLGGYHEAVLQVRGHKKEQIMGKMKNILESEDIVGVAQLKEGYDIRVIKKSTASRAINMLKDEFIINRSFKLAGDKKGEKLYRNFYAIR